jgi:hypothetical protein
VQYSVINTDCRKVYTISEKKKQQPPLSTISEISVSSMGLPEHTTAGLKLASDTLGM